MSPLAGHLHASQMLEFIGAKVTYDGKSRVVTVNAEKLTENTAPYDLMRKMRGSFLVLGPLLARMGEARVSLPGGCVLGSRPVDYHIKGLRLSERRSPKKAAMSLPKGNRSRAGQSISINRPHRHRESALRRGGWPRNGRSSPTPPAIRSVDTANFLNAAGAKIYGAGTPDIVIEPVQAAQSHRLHGLGRPPGSRDVCDRGRGHRRAARNLGRAGGSAHDRLPQARGDGLHHRVPQDRIHGQGPKRLTATKRNGLPYPGFPTDLQACISAACAVASGTSHIRDTVFVDRFAHAMEFDVWARHKRRGGEGIINGVERLQERR